MKTITLKLPEFLEARLNHTAQKSGLSKSEIVRRALDAYFSREQTVPSGSFLDLARDMAGAIAGPADLSTNKSYLDGYGA